MYENNETSLVLHADDGLTKLEEATGRKAKVQISNEFLKRRYVRTKQGIMMYSGRKHLNPLTGALGEKLCERDTPQQTTSSWNLTRSCTWTKQCSTRMHG